MAEQSLMLWRGENALEWEWEAWRKLQESDKMPVTHFLEAATKEEYELLDSQVALDGWEFQRVGDGWMRRITVYTRTYQPE